MSNALVLPPEELDGKVLLKKVVFSHVVEQFEGVPVQVFAMEVTQKVLGQLGFVCCIITQ